MVVLNTNACVPCYISGGGDQGTVGQSRRRPPDKDTRVFGMESRENGRNSGQPRWEHEGGTLAEYFLNPSVPSLPVPLGRCTTSPGARDLIEHTGPNSRPARSTVCLTPWSLLAGVRKI